MTFLVTAKPTPPTVFNLQASDWVHCEEETGVHTKFTQQTYKFVSFFIFITIVHFVAKKNEFQKIP